MFKSPPSLLAGKFAFTNDVLYQNVYIVSSRISGPVSVLGPMAEFISVSPYNILNKFIINTKSCLIKCSNCLLFCLREN